MLCKMQKILKICVNALDIYSFLLYNIITDKRKGGKPMAEKIKQLAKLIEQLNKLGLKIIELLGTATLLALSIKSLIELIK